MPVCPAAIAVAKPRKDSWLYEELLDFAFIIGGDTRVEKTRFPGVFSIYSSLDARRLSRMVARMEFSFMKRLVPSGLCLVEPELSELLEGVRSLLGGFRGEAIVSVAVRGRGKSIASEGSIERTIAGMGVRKSKKSRFMVAVESVDEVFIASFGTTGYCGYDCVYTKI